MLTRMVYGAFGNTSVFARGIYTLQWGNPDYLPLLFDYIHTHLGTKIGVSQEFKIPTINVSFLTALNASENLVFHILARFFKGRIAHKYVVFSWYVDLVFVNQFFHPKNIHDNY